VRRESGFTLVEVLTALAIAGAVVLVAHQLYTAVADGGRQLRSAQRGLDREANGRRWLKAAFLSLEVGQVPGESFDGDGDRMRFSAWQMTPGGWFERRRIELGRTDDRLVATLEDGQVWLADGVAHVAFDYLLEPGADTHWVRQWTSPVSVPMAVRMRIVRDRAIGDDGRPATDTLLFLIKERG
jgi:prepilin-type N-terminal cleavage/methylation domain-containing protein